MGIDGRTLRHTAGQFATGVTVVAVQTDGAVRAMTANSFSTLSLDPPLVLFCVGKQTRLGQQIHAASGFSINILSAGQQDLSTYFAGAWKSDLPPSFTLLDWEGGPRLEGAAASLGCEMHATHEGGDHWIVIGRVIAAHRPSVAPPPLVFHGGGYTALQNTRVLVPETWFEGIGW